MKKASPLHLSTQFIAVTVVLAVILSLVVSFLIKTVETKRLSDNLRERSVQTLDFVVQTSAPDFEAKNLRGLQLIVGQILKGEEDICRVRVVSSDGTVIIDKIKPKIGKRGEVLSVTRPVIGEAGNIGNISIYWELDRRLSAINKNAWFMVAYSFLAFFIAIVSFLLVSSSLVLAPVRKIENQLKIVSKGGDYTPLKLSNFYGLEFQHFAAAVDELHQRIIQQKEEEANLLSATHETQKVKQQLVQAIEAVTEGFVYYDPDDRLVICNEQYREIYKKSADLLIEGNSFEQIIRGGAERGQYEEAKGRIEEWVQERLLAHHNPSAPIEQKLPNGRWVRIVETRSEDGGLVGIRSDISEFKKYQKELKEAKEVAEHANEVKSQFLAMMSHEIRTPLNGVLGILGFLNDAQLDEDQKELVETGLDSASSLLTIINDILDFSKLEAGKMQLEVTAFDPSNSFDSILDLLLPSALAKGITLELEKYVSENQFLNGDASRLRQILLNLMGNAIKFTSEGGVIVRISSTAWQDKIYKVLFEVIDSGIGIAKDKHDLLFGQFVTVETSYIRKFGGTGLGLSICKDFVELMGGTIGFESEEGEGSRFWFEVPLEQVEGLKADESPELDDIIALKEIKNCRVLVVEDNAVNQMVARRMLEKIGCKVYVAGNGIEAVGAVTQFSYDLILMDISMPEMDGIAATKKIRKLQKNGENVPIIAMTAHAMKEEKEEFLAAGMDDYLQKPASAVSIHKILDQWLNRKRSNLSEAKENLPSNGYIEAEILSDLSRETGGEMFSDLIQCFIDDTASRKDVISNVFTAKQDKELETAVHSLGSSAATFGALKLHVICKDVEKLLKENNIVAAYDRAEQLDLTIEKSLIEIEAYIDGSKDS